MRQNRLAQMLGIHETLLSRIVNGFREPAPQVRRKIASILNSDEQWLFSAVEHAPVEQPRESEQA